MGGEGRQAAGRWGRQLPSRGCRAVLSRAEASLGCQGAVGTAPETGRCLSAREGGFGGGEAGGDGGWFGGAGSGLWGWGTFMPLRLELAQCRDVLWVWGRVCWEPLRPRVGASRDPPRRRWPAGTDQVRPKVLSLGRATGQVQAAAPPPPAFLHRCPQGAWVSELKQHVTPSALRPGGAGLARTPWPLCRPWQASLVAPRALPRPPGSHH